ncbi:MAG: FG-GAP-like repeat-containing protein [Bryobacteraceae bacterium]
MILRTGAALGLLCSIAAANPIVVSGTGSGVAPQVNVFDKATHDQVGFFLAYDPAFQGGVRVAVGDFNNDGVDDIVTGTGAGGGPHVKVFDGAGVSAGGVAPAELRSFFVFSPSFTGGVFVAAGDLNGDHIFDIIVGAGAGGPAQVNVFDGTNLNLMHSFLAYDGFQGGVYVAAGDINGDGFDDIITGAGAGGGPHVKVFDGVSGGELQSFFAFDAGFAGGVTVAAGDWNNDGRDDIITGMATNGGQVRVFDGATFSTLDSFFAFDPGFTGGVFVAGGSILTAPGEGSTGPVNVFPAPGQPPASFFAYGPGYDGGVHIAASAPASVPEPSSWMLLGLGLTAFACRRRKLNT